MTEPAAATNLDDFLEDYKPRTVTIPICRRADLLAEHVRLEAQAEADGRRGDLGSSGAVADLAALEEQIAESSTDFTFTAIPHLEWSNLMKEHPPIKGTPHHQGLDYNPDTFPHVAIAATSVNPKISIDGANKLQAKLPQGEWRRLWGAVLLANIEVVEPPKSLLVSVARQLNAASSGTAPR